MFKRVNNFLAALDIGSTKICATIGEISENGNLRIKGVGTSISSGIKKSGIENPIEIIASIKRAMLRAERMSGLVAEHCLLGFSGPFVQAVAGEGEMDLADGAIIGEADVDQLLEHIGNRLKKPGEKILHLVPLLFRLDGTQLAGGPVGQSGRLLQARVLVISINEEIYYQFIKAAHRAGIKIMECVVPALANFELLPERLKNKNLLMVDLGGKFTEVSYFRQRVLSGLGIVPVGSAHLTNDLAYGLHISLQEAERIKILFGRLVAEGADSAEEYLELKSSEDQKQPEKISKKFLAEILTARVREIFKKVQAEVSRMIELGEVDEIILTGGGSLLKDLDQEASRILGKSVVREKIVFNNELVASPVYNVSVGLILYGLKKGLLKPVAVPRNFLYQMVGETKRWFQEFF